MKRKSLTQKFINDNLKANTSFSSYPFRTLAPQRFTSKDVAIISKVTTNNTSIEKAEYINDRKK